jgi:hypothetical protein
VQLSAETFEPTSSGQTLNISYNIGRESEVSIYLIDAAGTQFDLRRDEPRTAADDAYTLRFDGTVPTDDPVLKRRLLPSGDYTVVVAATAENGETAAQRLPLRISGTDLPLPDIENLAVAPEAISPNADAVDDVAEITYQLPFSATVDIALATPAGQQFALLTRSEEGPGPQRFVWDGKRPDGSLLPNGVYTYTISVADDFGNLAQRQGTITLVEVGQPEARIVYANIAPRRVMLGSTITVTLRIRNTGTVPIRTYGPPSGYTYSTDQVFSSVEDGRYISQAGGFWRIGMDWDANSGGGAKRYPFRWALSQKPPEQWKIPGVEDWLMPGEEVEVVGRVVVQQRETKMSFYVGLIQDGVGFFQDRTGRTIIEIGF